MSSDSLKFPFNDQVLFEVNNNAIWKTVNERRRLWTTPYEDVQPYKMQFTVWARQRHAKRDGASAWEAMKMVFPLYQNVCVAGNMLQERSGRVSLARTVLCWAHITFKRLLRIKSLVTIASHTNSSLHVCRFSSEPKKNWWMQSEKNKYSRESPDTDVFWASPCGDGTRKQAQNGGGAFSIGYVFSSWRFHGITYTLGTTGLFAAGIFGVGRRPKRKVPKPEKAPEKSPAPRVYKILQEWLKWHEQCDKRSFL